MHDEKDIEKFLANFAAAVPDEALRGKVLQVSRAAWERRSRETVLFRRMLKIAAAAIIALNLVSAALLFYEGRLTDEFMSKCRTSPRSTDAMKDFVVGLGLDSGYAEGLVGTVRDVEDGVAGAGFEEQGAEVEKLLKMGGRQ